mmetsp:Transcript_43817/g.137635  ORF Transcript_43817/g.137635 Transcript_43817/m.137635 type:complete len:392 (+) Transcript_43817:176-1351(+)
MKPRFSLRLQAIQDMSAVDLTPAYEVYTTIPQSLAEEEDAASPYQLSTDPKNAPPGPDPFKYVLGDVDPLSNHLKDLVQTEHPVLKMAATQLLSKRQQGKRFRPTMVTLMSLACAAAVGTAADSHRGTEIYAKQGQLAQITEMIHVASLIHDDVLDEAETRRGDMAVHQVFSNKVAVLAGDYLLATASELLADLNDTRVVKIMASALKSLVQGEIMQLQAPPEALLDMQTYLKKSYHKTASLITLSCKSSAVLGGHDLHSDVTRAAEEYGYHLGLAYQIVDDILDFTSSTDILGKPACADMQLGLATAPVLYALEDDKSLRPLIMRRFKNKGDVEKAFDAVHSDGGVAIDKAMELALWHAQRAVDALHRLPPSDARDALNRIAHIVITRSK